MTFKQHLAMIVFVFLPGLALIIWKAGWWVALGIILVMTANNSDYVQKELPGDVTDE